MVFLKSEIFAHFQCKVHCQLHCAAQGHGYAVSCTTYIL